MWADRVWELTRGSGNPEISAELQTDPSVLRTTADALWFGLSFYEEQLYKPPYLPTPNDLGDFLAAYIDLRTLPLPARESLAQRFLTVHALTTARSRAQYQFNQGPEAHHCDLALKLGVEPIQFEVRWGLFAVAAVIKSKDIFHHLRQENQIGDLEKDPGAATGFFLLDKNFGNPPIPIIVIRKERKDLEEGEERIPGDIRHEDMHILCFHEGLYSALEPGVYFDHPIVHHLIQEQIPRPGDFKTLFSIVRQVRQGRMIYLQNELMATLGGGEHFSDHVLDDAAKPLYEIAHFAFQVAGHPITNHSYAEKCQDAYMLQAEIGYLVAYSEFLEQWSRFAVDNYPHPANAPGKPHDAFHWAGSRFLAVPEIQFAPERQPYPKEHSALLLEMIRPVDPGQDLPVFSPNRVNILGDAVFNIATAQHEDQRITIQTPFAVRTELFKREELPQLGRIAQAVLQNPETFALIDTDIPDPGYNQAVIERVIKTLSAWSDSPEHAEEVLSAMLLT